MSGTDPSDLFLADALRRLFNSEPVEWPSGLPAETSDLTAFAKRIEFHGIAYLLHSHADQLIGWPEHLLDGIADEARISALWEATHAKAISKLIETLEKAGAETVLAKVTALAYSLYPQAAARRRGDTDLLVRERDLDAARKILLSLGWYRKDDPHGLNYQEGWLCEAAGHFVHALDLHWQASDRPMLQEILSTERLFANRRALPRLGPHAHMSDLPLTMIHGAINQEWHLWHGYLVGDDHVKGARRLIWSLDFDLMARGMNQADWSALTLVCREFGIGPMIARTLREAAGDLATPLPAQIISDLGSQPANNDLGQYLSTTSSLKLFWLDLRAARDWRQRIGIFASRAFPPRDHLIKKYPRQAGWPRALLQCRFVLDTSARLMHRMISR